MMEYFNHKLSRKHHEPETKQPQTPVLTEEDEEFLQRIASEGTPPPLPERPLNLAVAGETEGNNAQLVLLDDARNVPLPDIPDTPDEGPHVKEDKGKGKEKEKVKEKGKDKQHGDKKPFTWSFMRRDSRDSKRKAQQTAGLDLHSVAEGIKSEDAQVNEDGIVTPHEGKRTPGTSPMQLALKSIP